MTRSTTQPDITKQPEFKAIFDLYHDNNEATSELDILQKTVSNCTLHYWK